MKKPQKSKAPPTVPGELYLDREDDRVTHMRWLVDQDQALSDFHAQVMRFLYPQQADITKKRNAWWASIKEKYNLPEGVTASVQGLYSPMPFLRLEPAVVTDEQASQK